METYFYQGSYFEWDDDKAQQVLTKHEVSFIQAVTVLFDPYAITDIDQREYEEERFISTGMSSEGKIITVVWTLREDVIRLITAFKANKQQIKRYNHAR